MIPPSPWSTPEGSSTLLSVVDCSTQGAEKSLEDLSTFWLDPSPRIARRAKSNNIRKPALRTLTILIWTAFFTICLLCWLLGGEKQSVIFQHGISLTSDPPALDGLQFIDADHPYIRYVGRWTSAADKSRKDGSFPGVYFDFIFNGSNTILISLYNTDSSRQMFASPKAAAGIALHNAANGSQAEPISLLARIDDDEYIVLPNASSIVKIRKGNLDSHSSHEVRIIAPMFGGEALETLQVEGIWIDEEGQLLPFETHSPAKTPIAEVEGLKRVGPHRKMLEIITDHPGSLAGRSRGKTGRSRGGVMGGVIGWEYLLGEMFRVDHVTIGMDGMCLIQDCIGGRGSPAGLADVFFQSGPTGSQGYTQPWLFEGYVPEVMVMNIGNADWDSFQLHNEEYNKTVWELSMVFEDTYISMIRAIRTLAYPKHSTSTLDSSPTAEPPIFVMRPFRGQLEQVTQSVVERLRSEGDSSIHWLDTSGWLETEVNLGGTAEDQDFFLDEDGATKHWRLTEKGNQRVAILTHMHVCRYLAQDAEKCAFLPPDIYNAGSKQASLDDAINEAVDREGQ